MKYVNKNYPLSDNIIEIIFTKNHNLGTKIMSTIVIGQRICHQDVANFEEAKIEHRNRDWINDNLW